MGFGILPQGPPGQAGTPSTPTRRSVGGILGLFLHGKVSPGSPHVLSPAFGHVRDHGGRADRGPPAVQGGDQRHADHRLHAREVGHHHPQGRGAHLHTAGAPGHPGESLPRAGEVEPGSGEQQGSSRWSWGLQNLRVPQGVPQGVPQWIWGLENLGVP